MKKTSLTTKLGLATVLVTVLSAWQSARATTYISDAFNYNVATLIGQGAWKNGTSGTGIQVTSGSLDGSVLGVPASTFNKVSLSSTVGTASYDEFSSGILSGSVYLSFLLRTPASISGSGIVSGGTLIVELNKSGSSSSYYLEVYVGDNGSGQIQLGLAKNRGTISWVSTTLNTSTTYFIVAKCQITSGSSNDTVSLWLNPVTGGSEPAGDVSFNTGADGSTSTGIGRFYLRAGATVDIDELRVADNWAEVTPAGAGVTAARLGFTTQPVSAQVGTTMSPVVVQVQSSGGDSLSSNGVPVTLTLTTGSGVLSGTTTQNTDSSGKATFSNLSINTVGTADKLTAAASGIGAGLASAVSTTFDITSGAPPEPGVRITSAKILPAGFVLSGSDTFIDTNTFCQCLGSSDITLPVDQWLLVNYGNEDPNGNITFTNPVSVVLPNIFYRLRIGNPATKENGPGILVGPASQTVAPGSTVTFTVSAAGPFLHYLWYKDGSPLANSDSSSLVINNAQIISQGSYSVAVANPVSTAVSAPATLRVGNFAPTISSQPQDQTNNAGGSVIFKVVADGTQPLGYKWYYNTNTPITDGGNITGSSTASLAMNNISSNSVLGGVGTYSCTVSNAITQLSSRAARLTVLPVPTALPSTNLLGFAEVAGVTGGAAGSNVVAYDYLTLSNYCRHPEPLVIQITNNIIGPGPNVDQYCYVQTKNGEFGNKTLIGIGTDAGLQNVDLRLNGTNIIIANLTFQVTPLGTNDAITIDGASSGTGKYVWVDHCTISNAQDGSVDVTKGADYVTVSWCKFIYGPKTPSFTHEFVHLVGSSDSDTKGLSSDGHFHVTFHHNWYSDNCVERMPSLRFAYGHVFNCYYSCAGNNYCARTRISSQTLVENCYYLGVQNPWEQYITSGTAGLINVSGVITNNCTFVNGWTAGAVVVPGTDNLPYWNTEKITPPYSDYTNALQSASIVPYYVQTYAGSGKYPYVTGP